jgi:hypothetical protein
METARFVAGFLSGGKLAARHAERVCPVAEDRVVSAN